MARRYSTVDIIAVQVRDIAGFARQGLSLRMATVQLWQYGGFHPELNSEMPLEDM